VSFPAFDEAPGPLPPINCMPAELLANPMFLLGRLGFTAKALAFEAFEEAGYNPYQYSILALLEEGARSTQGEIADALGFDRGTLVKLLDGLEERGLIVRQRDPKDRRRHVVSLTAAGKSQLAEFRTIVLRLDNDFLAPLDDEDRAELHDLLSRIAKHLDPRFDREGNLSAGS